VQSHFIGITEQLNFAMAEQGQSQYNSITGQISVSFDHCIVCPLNYPFGILKQIFLIFSKENDFPKIYTK
jgi:hypothetical protein